MQLKLLYVCVICWEGCDVHTDFFLTSGCTWGCFCLLTHFCTFALSLWAHSSRLHCSLYTFDVIYSLHYPYKQFCPVLGSRTGHG